MGLFDLFSKKQTPESIIIGKQTPTRQDTDQYRGSEQITWGDIKKEEESICEYFISQLSGERDPAKFVIEHRASEYTSLFYGNNNFLRVKFTPESKWLSFSLSNEDRDKHRNDPLFAMQIDKNLNHWKSEFSSKDDLIKYLELAKNACYELKVCGDEPLTEEEQIIADKLKEIMIKAGAKENHFKFRHLTDHAEVCYIQGRIRFKCMKKKKSWIEVDSRLSKKLGSTSKFEFNNILEIDGMTAYLEEYVSSIDANSEWYLKNGY